MARYIIVTETMCGNSYEWTTDDAGKETIYTYDSVEAAEKELAIDIEAFNEFTRTISSKSSISSLLHMVIGVGATNKDSLLQEILLY